MDQGQAGASPIPPARISQSASRMSVGGSDLQHPTVDPALLAAASRGRIAKREHNGRASDAPAHGEEANWILEGENEPYSNRIGCRYAVQISEKSSGIIFGPAKIQSIHTFSRGGDTRPNTLPLGAGYTDWIA